MRLTKRPEEPDDAGAAPDPGSATSSTASPPSAAEATPVRIDLSVLGEEDPEPGVEGAEQPEEPDA